MKFKSALTAFVACAAAVVSFTSRATALPEGYFRVEYIQSSGAQYIDTGINIQDKLVTEIDYVPFVEAKASVYMLAANGRIDGKLGNREYMVSTSETGQWRIGVGGAVSVPTTSITAAAAQKRYLVTTSVNGKTQSVSVKNISDGTAVQNWSKTDNTGLSSKGEPRTHYLFALHSGEGSFEGSASSKSSSKLYSCTIKTNTTVLARDYIPCYGVAEKQFGLYDMVSETFFASEGTTPFAGTIAVNVIAAGEGIDSFATGFSPARGGSTLAWNGTSGIEFTAPAEFMASAGRKGTVTGGTLYEIVGTTTNQLATTDTTTLTGQPNGYPLLMVWSATYSDGVVGAKDFYADPVNGDDDYAGEDIGSAEHPFKTLGKAHIAATNHIKTASAKAVIWLAEGRFDQKVRITFEAGESWIGKGKDKTFINASGCVTTGSDYGYLRLVSSDNLLSSVCVTGFVGGISKTIWVEKGLVDHCRSAYNTTSANSGKGRGLYLAGGTARFCEIDHNTCSSMYTEGAGANVCGGTLTDSDIHDNSTQDARFCKGAGINLSKGTVRRCRIWHNGYLTNFQSGELGGGVYLSGGTLENSLVYDNRVLGTGGAGGVHNEGGTVRYCTIVNNRTNGDTTCLSGYVQQTKSAAVAYNNIIVGNYKPGATVSTGTCRTNLLDAAVSGYSLNFVAGIEDVGFVDAKNGDFHIASAASPAVGKALVISAVKTDFEGTSRDPAKPTIGAYEYVAAAEDFSATIRVLNPLWREGSAPSVELVVTGAPDESKMSIAWFLDGTEVPAAANQKEPSFAGASLGRHTVKAIATYGTETETDERVDAFTVQPTKVYVNTTGTGTFPFATPETGTNSLNAALEALWKANDETTTVEVDEGTYRLRSVVSLQDRVEIVGKGAEKTHLRGFDTNARLITLDNAGSRLCGLTLTNSVSAGGLAIKSGLVDGCRIIRCNSTEYGGRGAGVNLAGGTLQNSEIVDCTMSTYTGIGGGIAILGKTAVVSNCTIRACRSHCGTREPHNHGGAGVYATNGTVTHCRILDCFEKSNEIATGVAVWSINGPSDTSNFILRNCLIAGCTSYNTEVVALTAGTMESCTVAGNTMPAGVAAVNCGGTVRNCVVWNGCADIAVNGGSVSYSCYSNATEGEDGNTAEDPKFRGVKHGEYKISSKSKAFRAGTVRGWMTGATDILGNPRLTDGEVDMGCYQVGFDPGLMILVW